MPGPKSANMSLGINLLLKLLREAAPTLAAAGFDIEIVEKHHNQKLDAPSGTALALADAVNEASDGVYTYVYDRSQERRKRDPHEIGISAVRGGTIVGDHDVIFAGTDEVITFQHTAYCKGCVRKGSCSGGKVSGRKACRNVTQYERCDWLIYDEEKRYSFAYRTGIRTDADSDFSVCSLYACLSSSLLS